MLLLLLLLLFMMILFRNYKDNLFHIARQVGRLRGMAIVIVVVPDYAAAVAAVAVAVAVLLLLLLLLIVVLRVLSLSPAGGGQGLAAAQRPLTLQRQNLRFEALKLPQKIKTKLDTKLFIILHKITDENVLFSVSKLVI